MSKELKNKTEIRKKINYKSQKTKQKTQKAGAKSRQKNTGK